jgi:N-acetylmuramoyl-L-alanine amidase
VRISTGGGRCVLVPAGILCLVAGVVLGPAAPRTGAQVLPLRAIVNGEPVSLKGNAILQSGTVMAPYQGLFAPMGIHAQWSPSDQTLTLTSPTGDEMELRPDDPYATVNGERRLVPVPLVAVLGRILIPVQWVFDTLGDVTAYDASTGTVVISPQITGITWREIDTGLEVEVEGTAPLHAAAYALHGPERLAVDVSGAVPKTPQQVLDVHEGPLDTVQVTGFPGGTRIVFTLTTPIQYHLTTSGPSRRIEIALSPGTAPPNSPPSQPSAYVPSALKITDIQYQHVDGGGRVVIVATQPLAVTQRILRQPDRIVLDVSDAVFIPVKKFVDVNDGLVIQVRGAQFHSNPNIARIVIELARPAPYNVHAGTEASQVVVDLGVAAAGPSGPLTPGGPGSHGPVVVALDPGHGGTDPGATGPTGVHEKDVVLAIARDLRALLAQHHIDVVMVRDGDVFVPLEDRAQIASRAGATMFVSIHANASVDSAANGTQTFYGTSLGAPLAATVLDEVSRSVGLAPRGDMQAQFKVLIDNPAIPAILVETAFITNPREEQLLRDPARQQAFAQGIARGIERYLAAQAALPQ